MSPVLPRVVASDPSLPAKVDIVIIGGGIIGVSAALFLAERGVQVLLCEKGEIGAEQSCRNWGWTRQMGRDRAELPLIIRSIQLWSEMQQRTGVDVGFRRTGATYLCRTPRQLAEYEAWMPLAKEYDIATRLISGPELSSFLGPLNGPFAGALHTATDGVAEPHLASPAIAEAARRQGAHIMTRCAVRTLETSAGHTSGVVTEHGAVACNRIILAAGMWSRLFAGNAGVSIPQLKILSTAARIDAPQSGIPAMPIGGDNFAFRIRNDGGYTIARRNAGIAPLTLDSFRLFGDFAAVLMESWKEFRLRIGKDLLESITMPRHWKPTDVTPFEHVRILDPQPSHRLNREALRNLQSIFPAFASSRITHEWAGAIDVTPDAVPIIGPAAQLPGLYIATGFSGHGFGLGPGAGELIADLATDTPTDIDPGPFRFERFQAKASAKGV